jgi:ABC-type spermidine/putrescine transport system permease subunit I
MWRIAGSVILVLLILVGFFLILLGFLFIGSALSSSSDVSNPYAEFRDLDRALIPQFLSAGLIAVVVGVCLLIGAWLTWRVARPKEVRDDSGGEGVDDREL